MALKSRMGELQRAVMDRLWADEDGHWFTVREIHESLAESRALAYTTVMTVVQRLAKKGIVAAQQDGRAHLYQAARSRGDMTADLMRQALDEFSLEDRRTALVAFVGEASSEEIAALRQALADLEGS